ncbi:MAG: SHOCT domain-containing protein [Ectothiorhodospiraceae bacterium]|nr:SHOCT domain-containing protein [Ectothiorhodospiraceae bacterium]
MLIGAAAMILFWAVVIALVILLVRWLGGAGGDSPAGRSRPAPLDILKERYARGEIDRDEYEQRRRDLEG